MADVSKLKKLRGRRAELGAPPTLEEASDNLAAPEVAPVAPVPEQAPAPARLPKMAVTDKVDGRSTRKTNRGVMLVEVLEKALDLYDSKSSS